MADVSVKIEGVDRLVAKLGQVVSFNLLSHPMERGLREIQAALQDYPVQRVPRTYTRTGGLVRHWTIRMYATNNTLSGVVGNNIEYAPYVQNFKFQAQVHKRTWLVTDKVALERYRPGIVAAFQRTINLDLS